MLGLSDNFLWSYLEQWEQIQKIVKQNQGVLNDVSSAISACNATKERLALQNALAVYTPFELASGLKAANPLSAMECLKDTMGVLRGIEQSLSGSWKMGALSSVSSIIKAERQWAWSYQYVPEEEEEPAVDPSEELRQSVTEAVEAATPLVLEGQGEHQELTAPLRQTIQKERWTRAEILSLIALLVALIGIIIQIIPDQQLDHFQAQNEILIRQNRESLELQQEQLEEERQTREAAEAIANAVQLLSDEAEKMRPETE